MRDHYKRGLLIPRWTKTTIFFAFLLHLRWELNYAYLSLNKKIKNKKQKLIIDILLNKNKKNPKLILEAHQLILIYETSKIIAPAELTYGIPFPLVGWLDIGRSEGACTTGSSTILYPVRPKASELLAENYRALAVYYAIHAEVSRFVSGPWESDASGIPYHAAARSTRTQPVSSHNHQSTRDPIVRRRMQCQSLSRPIDDDNVISKRHCIWSGQCPLPLRALIRDLQGQ